MVRESVEPRFGDGERVWVLYYGGVSVYGVVERSWLDPCPIHPGARFVYLVRLEPRGSMVACEVQLSRPV